MMIGYCAQTLLFVLHVTLSCLLFAAAEDGGSDNSATPRIVCYACTYIKSLHESQEHFQGEPNCVDPFTGDDDIPRVACSGPCGKNLFVTRPNEYMLVRGCQPNCKQKATDDGSFTKCCEAKLCNAAPPSLTTTNIFRQTLAVAALATLATFIPLPPRL